MRRGKGWLMAIGLVAWGCLAQEVPAAKPVLAVQDPNALRVGKILDREYRQIEFALVNQSEEEVTLNAIRSDCACMAIEVGAEKTVLPPGGVHKVRMKLHGGYTKEGPLTKGLMVDREGADVPLSISFFGEVVPALVVKPSNTLNLGNFMGIDVPWEKEFTITNVLTDGRQVTLDAPPDDELFHYTLEAKEQSWTLKLSPKLPLPEGRLRKTVILKQHGLENYEDVPLSVKGMVYGLSNLHLSTHDVKISRAALEEGQTVTATLRVLPGKAEQRTATMGRMGRRIAETAAAADTIAALEEESGVWKKKETWEKVSAGLVWKVPTGVTVERKLLEDGILLEVRLSAELLEVPGPKRSTKVLCNGRDIGYVNFRVLK